MSELIKPTKPYKSHSGMWLTGALFKERMVTTPADRMVYQPVFSFEGDWPGLINCRKTFVELMDPTGYQWAVIYLDSWQHFEVLVKTSWFPKELEKWVNEINVKLEAETIRTARSIAADESDRNRLTAARFLHSLTKPEAKPKRGRPSQAEVAAELQKEVQANSEFAQDMERMGLSVINGGRT